ncbi:MAG: hypothetical protein R6V19_05410 [Armatimonadota bacterium]
MRTARVICVVILIGLLLSTTAVAEETPQFAVSQTGFDLTIEFTQKDRAFLSNNIDQPLDSVRKDINVPILLHNVQGLPDGRKLLQPDILRNVKSSTFEAGQKPLRCWIVRPADQQHVGLFLAHCLVGESQRNIYSLPNGGQIQMDGVQIVSHAIVHPGSKVDINAEGVVGQSPSSAVALLQQQYNGPIEIIGQSMEKISISTR